MNNIIVLVMETINEVLVDNGFSAQTLTPDTNILNDTQLDSMGLAVVILKLEEKTGKDPFSEGFITFYTISELAKLYAR